MTAEPSSNNSNSHSKDNQTFIKFYRNDITLELMKDPPVFMLLSQIAQRARRTDKYNQYNLSPGECLIGDHKSIGLTQKQYRRAKILLIKGNFATFKRAFNGTIATIINTDVFDINIESGAIPFVEKGQSRGNLGATNKNVKKENNVNYINKESESDFFYLKTERLQFPVSEYLQTELKPFLDAWQLKNPTTKVADVLKKMDVEKVGHKYNNEAHIQNTFKKIAMETTAGYAKPKSEYRASQPKNSLNFTLKSNQPKATQPEPFIQK